MKNKSPINPILTKQSLATKVEFLVQYDSMRYSEAIIHVCEKLSIDPVDIAKLVTGSLHDKLEVEARKLNLISRGVKSTTGLI